MKIKNLLLTGVFLGAVSSQTQADPVVVYLADPDDKRAIEILEAKDYETADDIKKDLLDQAPLDRKHKRLRDLAHKEEREFTDTFEIFLSAKFDPLDDGAEEEFNDVREKMVKLIFNAPTEKDFYQRLYLLNEFYLGNLKEKARFDSLDHALQEKWVETSEKRQRIRELAIGGGAIVGAALGAYGFFKLSNLSALAKESSLIRIIQTLGRVPVIVFGTLAGAAFGATLGYLGSGFILSRQIQLINPIENEDLVELLDIADKIQY